MNQKNRVFIGERLKQERKRIGWSRAAMGEVVGVSSNAVLSWENGITAPGADALVLLAAHDVDVLYVVLGQRTPGDATALSAEESTLIERYRQSSSVLRGYLHEFGSAPLPAAAGAVTIGGNVDQVVEGGATFNAPITFGGGKRPK